MHGENLLQNGDSRGFWDGVNAGRLIFQSCCACGHVQFPPRHQCATCWHDQLDLLESTGQGVVESSTVVRRAPLAAFRAKVPYVVASIIVDEGPRMITNIVGPGAIDCSAGDRVTVCFERDAESNVLPQFRLR